MVCSYGGNKLVSATVVANGMLKSGNGLWKCEVRGKAPKLEVSFALLEGEAKETGVAVAFDFSGWSTNNYVLAPAALYNGNRYRSLSLNYPPYIYDVKQRPLDMPITVTDIPRLNPDGAPGKVEMLTGSCATPMLAFHDAAEKRGWILLTAQATRLGNSGLIAEENAEKGQATFVVSAPGVRENHYRMCRRAESKDRGADWRAGDEVTLKFDICDFPAPELKDFLARVFDVRKALTGPNEIRNIAPYSYIADIIVRHFDADKWHENPKYPSYSNRPGSKGKYAYQIGWNGPPVYSMPPAILESPERISRVSRTLDTLTQARGKTGLFYAMYMEGLPIGDNFSDCWEKPAVSMIRRTGETVHFGLRQLDLFRKRGHAVKPEWENMFRSASDALVKVFEQYGQFGQFIDVDTGVMDINGSTSGSVCITALAAAADYFKELRYLEVAEKAGRFYYNRDLARGYAGGGPAEILQAPDSESAYNLVEAYVVLHDLTGKREWLDRAVEATHLFSTWMVSYDYQFPKGCDMARVNARSTGSIWASVQNTCSTPGLYISSGDFLLRLYRSTGDKRIAELYRDTAHNVIQYVNTKTNPINQGGRDGYVSERVNLGDWEGAGKIGRISAGDSNMAWESLAALTCLENPGIYVRMDTGEMIVLDHVEVEPMMTGGKVAGLKIKNLTPYDARVKVLAENAEQAAKPLCWNAFEGWPEVDVPAGQMVEWKIVSK